MKGMVFTEFIEFVEDTYGFNFSNQMIEKANLPSKGVYTAVGTYSYSEFVSMVVQLSNLTNVEVPQLLINYGKHLFFRFIDLYPQFLKKDDSFFDFISKIDGYIHVEVQKLYPDAELPSIEILNKTSDSIELIYSSNRKFSDFAEGLLSGAAEYFNENVEIDKELILADGSKVKFLLRIIK